MLRPPSLIRFLACDGYPSFPSVIRSDGLSQIILVKPESDPVAVAFVRGRKMCIRVARNTQYANIRCFDRPLVCFRLRPLQRTNNISGSEERKEVQHCAHTNSR